MKITNRHTNKCGHEGTFIYMGQPRYMRGYLLTYCLDCEKTIKAVAIESDEDKRIADTESFLKHVLPAAQWWNYERTARQRRR